MAAVRQVLEEVDATEVPLVEVFNKCDLLEDTERRRVQAQDPSAVCISASRGYTGSSALRSAPSSAFSGPSPSLTVCIA